MYRNNGNTDISSILRSRPYAYASMDGNESFPQITGSVKFYPTQKGVLVAAEIIGLPKPTEECKKGIFGFHIHEGESCTGSERDPLSDTGAHYDADGCPHPYHSGDLPPLFGNDGYALSVFLTDRFTLDQVIGKTVVIHSGPDDFTTDPSGNSGTKIACGVIRR